MRNLIFVFTLLILIACSKQEKSIIRVKIENASIGMVYFDELKSTGNHPLDSAKLTSYGKVKFIIPLEIPGFYQLRFKDEKAITLLLFPSEKVYIKADYNNFYETKTIEGSKDTRRVIMLDDSLRVADKKLLKLKVLFDSLTVTSGNEAKTDSLSQLFVQIKENHKKYSIKFILEDIKSLSNIEALYQQYFSDEYVFKSSKDVQIFKLVSDSLIKYYPKVGLVRLLKDNSDAMVLNLQKEKILQMVKNADNHVPDLRLISNNGGMKSLSSLRGKIVLLDFWSINQAESINELAGLKYVYRKYHGSGFEILQVSIDKSLSDWKETLATEKITWPSVCDTAFPDSKTRILFNINTLPMNYLINKDQTDIIAKNISPTELGKILTEILK
jgi:hypothetical protein